MFHVLAQQLAFDTAAIGEFYSLTPVTDKVVGTKNFQFVYGRPLKAFAGSVLVNTTELERIRLVTPTLRSQGMPMLRPWNIDVTATPAMPGDPNLAVMLQRSPLLRQQEGIVVQGYASSVATTMQVYALLWVTVTGIQPMPTEGDIITIQGEQSNVSITANVWTEVSLDWLETLPKGTYAVVGSECICSTGIAHRWIFDNQVFRPGALSMPSLGERTHRVFYDGTLGTWGTFISQVPPRLEVLCSSTASIDFDAFLQVVRVGD